MSSQRLPYLVATESLQAGAAVAAKRHCWHCVLDKPSEGRKKQHLNLPTKLNAVLQELLQESGLASADVALHT